MRGRIRDRDLPDNLALRRDHGEHGVAGERALRVEAEARNVDVVVRPYREAFGAALHARRDVGQNGQHVDVAAVPCASRCRRQNPDHEPDRALYGRRVRMETHAS